MLPPNSKAKSQEVKLPMSVNNLCEECKKNPWKYKCPGCSLRSCSLPCVNSHKKRTECTGKRNRTKFVPLSQFEDNVLLSDYNLLEEMKRNAEAAHRQRAPLSHRYKLPSQLQILKNAASHRRLQMRFLPNGMSKRERNQSYCDKRKRVIYWTIEWRFNSTNEVSIDHGVHEDTIISSAISKHLQSNNKGLKQFLNEPMESLRVFIRKYPGGCHSPFYELDMNSPLKQQLHDVVLLEYPVIHVYLPSKSIEFDVLERRLPREHKPEPVKDEGVAFKEEEIEEADDLRVTRVEDGGEDTGDTLAGGDRLHSSLLEIGSGLLEDYDMDKSLEDTYTSIMEQMDSDNLFNLEDVLLDIPDSLFCSDPV